MLPFQQPQNVAALSPAVGGGPVLPSYGAHRYWGILTSATSGGNTNVVMAELKMFSSVGGSDIAAGKNYGATSASSPGTDQTHAFDGDTTTFWSSQAGGLPARIWVDFGSGITVGIWQWAITGNSVSGAAAPKTMKLQYADSSPSVDASWTDAYAPADSTAWGAGETRTFTFPGP